MRPGPDSIPAFTILFGGYCLPSAHAVNAYKLLIVDEIGYLPMRPQLANLFLQIVARRCECSALILTSNLTFGSRDRQAQAGILSGEVARDRHQ
ncbi:MAG: ATP-binding protein [Candidatus Binataceae bacterium]|nr:ATP-binding protein [Candidatus Binataceae bacterium]